MVWVTLTGIAKGAKADLGLIAIAGWKATRGDWIFTWSLSWGFLRVVCSSDPLEGLREKCVVCSMSPDCGNVSINHRRLVPLVRVGRSDLGVRMICEDSTSTEPDCCIVENAEMCTVLEGYVIFMLVSTGTIVAEGEGAVGLILPRRSFVGSGAVHCD